ncbi:MAG: penicillin-binding protein 2 [Gaiellaceae bacterium]
MNRQISRLAVFAVTLVIGLVVTTTYWQTWAAPGLADRQDNAIERVAEFTIERGRILAADGTVLARNRTKRVGGKTFYFRRYPQGRTFSHVVGYSTQGRSRAGLERSLNDYLTASNANLTTVLERTLDQIRGTTIQGNDVFLTLSTEGQRVAQNALGTLCGAVAALDPQTGKVLVLASSPSYDPNLIEERFAQAQRAPNAACTQPAAPLLNRAVNGLYTPGSTFKVVTAAAALDQGKFFLSSTFDDPGYCTEYGKRVFNYSDQGTPSGYGRVTLLQAIESSINSVFCNIGIEIGAGAILEYARRFGFYSKPPLELPAEERLASGLYKGGRPWFPEDMNDIDPGRLAFGQERLQVTPLQMAMVAGAIANDGILVRPQLVERVVSPQGRIVTTPATDELGRPISRQAADAITQGMIAAVRGGTSTAAQIVGIEVAGKTGTAEIGRDVNTTSFIAFAPAENPRVAIAVFLEEQDGVGGTTAAPIAKLVMEALLRDAGA